MGQPNRPPVTYWQFTAEGNDPLPTDAKYTNFEEIERAITAAKRELTEKVRDTIQIFMPPITAEYDDADRSLTRTLTALLGELERVFTESGVAVEKEG